MPDHIEETRQTADEAPLQDGTVGGVEAPKM